MVTPPKKKVWVLLCSYTSIKNGRGGLAQRESGGKGEGKGKEGGRAQGALGRSTGGSQGRTGTPGSLRPIYPQREERASASASAGLGAIRNSRWAPTASEIGHSPANGGPTRHLSRNQAKKKSVAFPRPFRPVVWCQCLLMVATHRVRVRGKCISLLKKSLKKASRQVPEENGGSRKYYWAFQTLVQLPPGRLQNPPIPQTQKKLFEPGNGESTTTNTTWGWMATFVRCSFGSDMGKAPWEGLVGGQFPPSGKWRSIQHPPQHKEIFLWHRSQI